MGCCSYEARTPGGTPGLVFTAVPTPSLLGREIPDGHSNVGPVLACADEVIE